jgi:D-alanyl-D-alanine carboxypeptidase (penicillin-binding protein 5/6)
MQWKTRVARPPLTTILRALMIASKLRTLSSLTLLLMVAALPVKARAQSAIMVVDQSNRKVHLAANANDKRAVGGLTKIATAMVVLDWADASKVSLNVLATVPEYAERIAGVASPDIRTGDSLTLRDLLYATMMSSDNVAAITLGHFVGNDLLMRQGKAGDPLEAFVKQMNALAGREGCKNTRFMNPHGYENTRPQPYSTAADIGRLALYASSRAPFHFYANQRSRQITIFRGGARVPLTLRNTNVLLGESRIDGMKTANTPYSGGCVAITADKNATVIKQADGSSVIYRHRMIVIVLGSADPFSEARGYLHQGWGVYDTWLNAGRPITQREQLLQYF